MPFLNNYAYVVQQPSAVQTNFFVKREELKPVLLQSRNAGRKSLARYVSEARLRTEE